MRKTLSLFFICLLFFSLFQNTFAKDLDYDLSCFDTTYTFDVTDTQNGRILFQNFMGDAIALQDKKILETFDYTEVYKNIPFKTNIQQNTLAGVGRYHFPEIDSFLTKEISIELLESPHKITHYRVNFSISSLYHEIDYYFSEDGEYYFLSGPESLTDFVPKYIKIVLKAKSPEPKREKIYIHDLSIERTSNIIGVHGVESGKNITIYTGNRCGKKVKIPKLQGLNYISGGENIPFYTFQEEDMIFRANPLYTQKTNDTDNDGVSDLQDNCKSVKNRDQKDLNQNGVGDACEFDSDSDGIPDEVDNCRNTSNPEQGDTDKDNIGNSCDNCNIYNPNQRDENNNGVGDVCEQKEKYIQENDEDSDGIINSQDNCKDIANSDQQDSDNDGIGDVCDNCKTYQNRGQEDINENGIGDICEDSDKDGIHGLRDNCPNVANQDQKDSDNDGIGDVCEDDDRDKVLLVSDNCPYIYNPKQIDTDSDGQGDICDETDNRFIESNKTLFIFLMLLITAAFMGGIFFLGKQIQKKS